MLGASAEAGTGWAIAKTLAAAGAKVVVGARRLSELQARASTIGATAVVCDAGRGIASQGSRRGCAQDIWQAAHRGECCFFGSRQQYCRCFPRDADRAHRGQLFRQRRFRQAYGKGDRSGWIDRAHFLLLGAEHNFAVFPLCVLQGRSALSRALCSTRVRARKSGSIQFSRVRYGPKRHARSGPVREWSNCSLAMYR